MAAAISFTSKLHGALYGTAIGDAMGAPVEGLASERIRERITGCERFLPPTHGGDPATGKGDGRITDDTLMTEALMQAYIAAGTHLDAHGWAQFVLPQMAKAPVWVSERQREMPILERLFWPEKYPWQRLHIGNAEPRHAGIGNCVNCGVAMYMMPVGAVNAGDPDGAYAEATALGLAHNESFAVEAAGVMAGAMAAAFAPQATVQTVLDAAARLGRDGTARGVAAAITAGIAARGASRDAAIASIRAAVAPFDQRSGHTSDDAPIGEPSGPTDIGRPSRLAAIEELPVALAMLAWGDGDWQRTISGAVFYGRDCDSIAGMACGLYGAIFGAAAIPQHLRQTSNTANRRDWTQIADAFAPAVQRIHQADAQRLAARRAALG